MKKIQVLCSMLLVCLLIVQAQNISYYVKTTGVVTNTGLSWEQAIPLSKALSTAVSKDTIHIAAGTYKPVATITGGSSSDIKDRTFEIAKNIALIGGYPANATTGAVANSELYLTVFDGHFEISPTVEERLTTGTDLIGSITSSSSYDLTSGVTAAEIAYISKQGSPMKIFVFEIDLANPNLDLEVSTPDNQPAFKRQEMTVQATYEDQTGHKVIGGVNGDFFDMDNGTPQGILYKNGVAIKETFYDATTTYFAITKDKKAIIAGQDMYAGIKSTIKEALGGRVWLVRNGSAVGSSSVLEPRTCAGVSADGLKVYFLVVDGRNPLYSIGMAYPDLSKIMKALGSYNAINLDGGGSSTFFIRNSSNKFEMKNQPRSTPESPVTERAVANGLVIISK